MSGDSFRFKEFTVHQSRSAMKVGTDGVIIGSWASVCGAEGSSILDIGSGTGLIALMVAQRNRGSVVDAVELDSGAAADAIYNFARSPFSERLRLYEGDFQSYALECQRVGRRYDLIVSNPPYFNGTYKSIDSQRAAARHTELLPTEDLIDGVCRLLEPTSGCFAAIFPYVDAAIFIARAAAKGLYCTRLLEVYAKEGREAKRMAAEFSTVRTNDVVSERLVILGPSGYSDQYKNLTSDFYIRF